MDKLTPTELVGWLRAEVARVDAVAEHWSGEPLPGISRSWQIQALRLRQAADYIEAEEHYRKQMALGKGAPFNLNG